MTTHTPRTIAEALHRTIQRDPNPHATVRRALLSSGTAAELLVDVADPTGANGGRSFVVRVREVDPPEGNEDDVAHLAALIVASAEMVQGEPLGITVARRLLDAGVTL